MNALWTELEGILHRHVELHTELLAQAENKRAAIIEGDLDLMETTLAAEQRLIGEVEREEARRVAIMEQARDVLAISDEPIKLAMIVERLDEPAKSRIQAIHDRLKKVLDKLRYRHRQNGELLRVSIDHANAFLTLVAQALQGGPRYDRKGVQQGGSLRLLDQTA